MGIFNFGLIVCYIVLLKYIKEIVVMSFVFFVVYFIE